MTKNWGELPIFLDKGIIIIPHACAWTEKIREIEIGLFTSVPYGETEIRREGNYGYLESYDPYNTKVKLYSEGNEVANSSVKVTTVE